MTIRIEAPEFFFYELIEKSRFRKKLRIPDEIKVYVQKLLTDAIDKEVVNLEEPLSLVYLQACEGNNNKDLKLAGDTALFLLGFFPQSRPSYKDLYYGIGAMSYQRLSDQSHVYEKLSERFYDTVELVAGVQDQMITSDHAYPIIADNIIQFKR